MSTKGSITHCDVFFFAGQKNATNGNAGLWELAFESGSAISLLVVAGGGFFFLRDLLDEEGAAMVMLQLPKNEIVVVEQWTRKKLRGAPCREIP